MTELGVTGTVNINDLPFAHDRSRAWRELREGGEAVTSGEEVVLTSAAAVEFAAKRPQIFSSAKAFDVLGSPVPLVPIAIDPPDHTRFRRMLDPFFSPKKMAEREPELRQQAGELIDVIVAKGECEVMADLATPFPSQVFLTLFGLPMADRDRLVHWKDAILQFTDPGSGEPTPEVLTYALELFTYLNEHIAERRTDTLRHRHAHPVDPRHRRRRHERHRDPRPVLHVRARRPRHRHLGRWLLVGQARRRMPNCDNGSATTSR